MPRYRPDSPFGYDLTREVHFAEQDGVRYATTEQLSVVMTCWTCGAEHFRDRVSPYETCFRGHGPMERLKYEDSDKANALWLRQEEGRTLTTVEQRKAARLEREKERPWTWVFGETTEADYPDGFAETKDGKKLTPA